MTKDLYDKLMVFGNDREPFLAHNFMRTTDLDDGTATVTLPMHTESLNRWGGAHGGILFSLCDVAMGMAIMTLRQEMVVTVNATIDYLSAAAAGSAAVNSGRQTSSANSLLRIDIGLIRSSCLCTAAAYFPLR